MFMNRNIYLCKYFVISFLRPPPTYSKDPASRPTAQLLTLIKYFSDPAVHALQFLDVINMKDVSQKTNFYRVTLKDHLLYIPRVNF